MKIWKDREGNKLTINEFFSRWKEGIQQTTPYQLVKINIIGSLFVFAGIFIGLYATFITKVWWLFLILIGSFILTSTSFIGTLQKYFLLKDIKERLKGGKDESESTI